MVVVAAALALAVAVAVADSSDLATATSITLTSCFEIWRMGKGRVKVENECLASATLHEASKSSSRLVRRIK